MVTGLSRLGCFNPAKPRNHTKVPVTVRRLFRSKGEEFVSIDILVGRKSTIDPVDQDPEKQPWAKGTVLVACRQDIITLKKGRASDQDKVDTKRLEK